MFLQALRGVMTKLSEVGQSASIVEVVYKYMELQDGKAGESATTVEMTLAKEESAADVEAKKAMLRAFPPPLVFLSCCWVTLPTLWSTFFATPVQ